MKLEKKLKGAIQQVGKKGCSVRAEYFLPASLSTEYLNITLLCDVRCFSVTKKSDGTRTSTESLQESHSLSNLSNSNLKVQCPITLHVVNAYC